MQVSTQDPVMLGSTEFEMIASGPLRLNFLSFLLLFLTRLLHR